MFPLILLGDMEIVVHISVFHQTMLQLNYLFFVLSMLV